MSKVIRAFQLTMEVLFEFWIPLFPLHVRRRDHPRRVSLPLRWNGCRHGSQEYHIAICYVQRHAIPFGIFFQWWTYCCNDIVCIFLYHGNVSLYQTSPSSWGTTRATFGGIQGLGISSSRSHRALSLHSRCWWSLDTLLSSTLERTTGRKLGRLMTEGCSNANLSKFVDATGYVRTDW